MKPGVTLLCFDFGSIINANVASVNILDTILEINKFQTGAILLKHDVPLGVIRCQNQVLKEITHKFSLYISDGASFVLTT